ncbi:MAG: hypothetical protein ACE5ID_00950 [Acidobacteriota bacterium]
MNRNDLERLRAYQGFPALTLRLPTHRKMPEARQDPTRIKNMIRRAGQALRERGVSPHLVQDYLERLDQFRKKLDYRYLDEALFVFVGEDLLEAIMLPGPVTESVTVDDSFVTRDLVRALGRQPRYFMLVLSEKATRWFSGWGYRLVEETGGGFPMANQTSPDESPCFSRGVDPKRLANERLRVFLRRVAEAVQEKRREAPGRPLFVAGVKRLRSFYGEVAGADSFAGQVEGSLEHARSPVLAQAVAPVLDKWQRARRQEVLDRFLSVQGSRQGLTGVEEIGRAAAAGRVETLLLENQYSVTGFFDRKTGQVRIPHGPSRNDAHGDVVDEIVETVIGHGGDVSFYQEGRLGGETPMGAILRF